uniref:Gene silencing suppressor n=1 Tax=Peanut stunt virus TaxID=12313 RepID=A0A8F8QQK1_9BROM|nr:gene silencing suppressor [Peanut stunt virus]
MLCVEEIQRLRKVEQKVKAARARHRANRKFRGHKSPSEVRRRELRETLFLLKQLPAELPEIEDVSDNPSYPPSYTSCDETDWFAGNEWCEGSF